MSRAERGIFKISRRYASLNDNKGVALRNDKRETLLEMTNQVSDLLVTGS